MRMVRMAYIGRISFAATGNPGVYCALAGSVMRRDAPGGLGSILSRSGGGSLGVSGGLTLIKSAAAFGIPAFNTTAEAVRSGAQVEHYAVVQPTTSKDTAHESFYPGPGEHLRPGMTQVIRGKTYQHYWVISRELSDLIRRGEQEHLDDAQRAYDLTYKLVADQINAIAGQRFGPARTPHEAIQLAEQALAQRMPRQLGTNPSTWVQVLDRLLQQSKIRDRNGWHALSIDPDRTVGNKILHPVSTMPTAKIGTIPSSQVVNY